jgi:hypothetical protein
MQIATDLNLDSPQPVADDDEIGIVAHLLRHPAHSMNRAAPIALPVLIILFAAACGRQAGVHWRDGSFEVYATDTDFTATKLGYNHHPSTLGLVSAEVVAAGSNHQCVFVERFDRASGQTEFYIVPKEGMPEHHSGRSEGPFSATEFRELRSARQLPEFTWKKK